MKDQLRLQSFESEMSATILSAFYDIDMLYKDKSLNMNAIHLNSVLDKKAVGAPVSASNCSFPPTFYRRNSASSADCPANSSNKFPSTCYSNLKESCSSTAIMNKENKFRERAYSETGERSQQLQALQQQQQKSGSQINSTRYKTELCRPFEENGSCKYGEKCQFAHGFHELRSLSRHPKYKTEPCRTFHTIGFCPYGPRCHFIHNADERRPAPLLTNDLKPLQPRPKLHHSLSFSGFSTAHGLDSNPSESPMSRTPPPSSAFYEDVLSPAVNGPFSAFNTAQDLKALLAPLTVQAHSAFQANSTYYSNFQASMPPSSPPYNLGGALQTLQRLSESPVFDSPPSSYDSMSDRESHASGSLSSSGSLSGSESPSLDAGRRLPIFSRLSISDD